MNINNSPLWLSDIDEIIRQLPELGELSGSSVMITGCTGLICSALTDMLCRRNVTHDGRVIIYAAGRNRQKIEDRFAPYSREEWFRTVEYDALTSDNTVPDSCDYIIHGAGIASPNLVTAMPVETVFGMVNGTKQLLEQAKGTDVRRVLYISSSEVYGSKSSGMPNVEDKYGSIDILNPRNSYSVGKCAAEMLCSSFSKEYDIDVVIVRPGHIYGPTATEADARVSSLWAYDVSRGDDIIMKSDGSQVRSYCHCLDCASAMVKILLYGKRAEAYNISDPASVISIRELAVLLAETAGVGLKRLNPTEKEKEAFNPMDNSSLDGSKLKQLGWNPLFDAGRGVSHTVRVIRESMER